MSLLDKQKLFARLLGRLLIYINVQGYTVTMGEGYLGDSINKPSEDTPHLREGTHFLRLGQDLNLFVDHEWARDAGRPEWAEAWQKIGGWWKSQDELCRWGGDFGDLNHFSITHGGVS